MAVLESCPRCGGPLAWEEAEGFVVCTRCGLVVDRISLADPPRQSADRGPENRWRLSNAIRAFAGLKRRYRSRLRAYERISKLQRRRPWLIVDAAKLLEMSEAGRVTGTITSRASLFALEKVRELNLGEQISRGLEMISASDPTLLARSLRARYALAYMAFSLAEFGTLPSAKEVTEIFNVSASTYRRLAKLLLALPFVPGGSLASSSDHSRPRKHPHIEILAPAGSSRA
ncbi:MAG: TFIIB-type zinc ribbon-containing protein [Desulfurococcaceae archaeon]